MMHQNIWLWSSLQIWTSTAQRVHSNNGIIVTTKRLALRLWLARTRLDCFVVADTQEDFFFPTPMMPPACSSSTSLPPAVNMAQQASSSSSRPSAEASQEVSILEPGMSSLDAATLTVVLAASEAEAVADYQLRFQ